MKTFSVLLAILVLMTAIAPGDEILLKDGKKISWTSIRDLGDSYEVETSPGTKTAVRKSDIDKIITIATPDNLPLTGASFSFEKKRRLTVTNLLAGIDLKKAAFQGTWTQKGAELQGVSGVEANSRFVFPAAIPDEYDLTLEIARKAGDGDLEIGLVVGGKQGLLAIDAVSGTVSAFCLEGKAIDASSGVAGRFFTNGTPRSIVCMVRKNGVVVQADGKDFMTLPAGDLGKLFVPPTHAVPRQDTIFLVCWKATYSVTKAILSAPKAQP